MTPEQHMAMLQMLNKVTVDKYKTHDTHTELVVNDGKGNVMEIKFYPADERGEE